MQPCYRRRLSQRCSIFALTMQHTKLKRQTFVKSFGSFIVFFGIIYIFMSSDLSRGTVYIRRRGQVRSVNACPSPSHQPTCRTLFTISLDVHHHLLQTSARNWTHREDVRGDEWVVRDSAGGKVGDREWWSAAAKIVQQLVQKRSSLSGAPTSYYYSLAAFLPKLLSFSDDSHGEERDEVDGEIQTKYYRGESRGNISKQTNSPFFRERSRVVAGGGVLPYVPCVIASYQQPAAFTKCFRRRLERKPRLWLFFMGDSKIRNLFTEFINRTDSEYNYAISYLNTTEPWPTLRQRLVQDEVRWGNMEARTEAAPRLRISFSFQKLNQIDPSEFNEEIADLWRWASGEPSPDLLVVGYTTWMMEVMNLYSKEANMYTANVLDLLMEKHSVVVPLLEQISRRSRVLVLPQSRLRPHSVAWPNLRGAFTDAIFDWSEMTFLHLLRQHTHSHGSEVAGRENLSDPWEPDGDTEDHKHIHNLASCTPPHNRMLPKDEAFRDGPQSDRVSERGWTPQYQTRMNETKQGATVHQKYQRSSGSTDANPRSLVTRQETRNPVENSVPQGTTERALTFLDHLIPTRSSSGVWWWDSSLPLNLAGILECSELYNRGLASHRIYREDVLQCMDVQHAGWATNNDLVTMLLNLLCNSVAGLHHTYCCT
ncbi:uncharacterized protein [Panulirus ornatus]|uniref:uncharacterized protein n=1 Tax=Panulirus ornatus TaxID=150431 RepID=UPI003A883392